MIYKWRYSQEQSNRNQVQAQRVGERLEEIGKHYGAITPELVVTDARGEDSPLHNHFEWDNSVAAESYRLHQARMLIAAIEVTVEETRKPARAFISVHIGDKRGYVPIQRAMSDEEMRTELVSAALTELQSVEARYNDLHELADVYEKIEQTSARYNKRKRKAS